MLDASTTKQTNTRNSELDSEIKPILKRAVVNARISQIISHVPATNTSFSPYRVNQKVKLIKKHRLQSNLKP